MASSLSPRLGALTGERPERKPLNFLSYLPCGLTFRKQSQSPPVPLRRLGWPRADPYAFAEAPFNEPSQDRLGTHIPDVSARVAFRLRVHGFLKEICLPHRHGHCQCFLPPSVAGLTHDDHRFLYHHDARSLDGRVLHLSR